MQESEDTSEEYQESEDTSEEYQKKEDTRRRVLPPNVDHSKLKKINFIN